MAGTKTQRPLVPGELAPDFLYGNRGQTTASASRLPVQRSPRSPQQRQAGQSRGGEHHLGPTGPSDRARNAARATSRAPSSTSPLWGLGPRPSQLGATPSTAGTQSRRGSCYVPGAGDRQPSHHPSPMAPSLVRERPASQGAQRTPGLMTACPSPQACPMLSSTVHRASCKEPDTGHSQPPSHSGRGPKST